MTSFIHRRGPEAEEGLSPKCGAVDGVVAPFSNPAQFYEPALLSLLLGRLL